MDLGQKTKRPTPFFYPKPQKMKLFTLSFALVFCTYSCVCQTNDTKTPIANLTLQTWEDLLRQHESLAEEIDFVSWVENLRHFREHPLSLNEAERRDWKSLGLLDDRQIQCLLDYRREVGPLLAMEELQAVPCLELETVRCLLPFVSLEASPPSARGLYRLFRESRHSLFLRWNRRLASSAAYLPDTTGLPRYEGSPDRWYVRFRKAYGNQLSLGFTAEKDPGEALFRGSNAHGFDYLSAHLFLRDLSPAVGTLALGDYSVSLGQGLLTHAGFGGRKSAMVMNIVRSGPALRRYASVDENRFMRGAAVQLRAAPQLEALLFVSSHRIDANLSAPDTVSSLLRSGLHRDAGERADENALRQQHLGGRIGYQGERLRIHANALYHHSDKTIMPRFRPYNRYYFRGRRLLNLSLDYTFTWRNLYFFGEAARSDNGALATVNGLLLGLGRGLDLALHLRHLSPRYQAPLARTFTENTRAQNESGIYLALQFQPSRPWLFQGYLDLYRHPWLRFRTDAPSHGREWRLRASYTRRRDLEVYAEARQETKLQNGPEGSGSFRALLPLRNTQLRLHLSKTLARGIEWRLRLNAGWVEAPDGRQQGFQIHQDFIYKPMGTPLHASARLAWFDTDSYDVRFYNYENGLLYQFAIPAYYRRGLRYYLNLRWRGWKRLVVEARWATTVFLGELEDDFRDENNTELGMQVKWEF